MTWEFESGCIHLERRSEGRSNENVRDARAIGSFGTCADKACGHVYNGMISAMTVIAKLK